MQKIISTQFVNRYMVNDIEHIFKFKKVHFNLQTFDKKCLVDIPSTAEVFNINDDLRGLFRVNCKDSVQVHIHNSDIVDFSNNSYGNYLRYVDYGDTLQLVSINNTNINVTWYIDKCDFKEKHINECILGLYDDCDKMNMNAYLQTPGGSHKRGLKIYDDNKERGRFLKTKGKLMEEQIGILCTIYVLLKEDFDISKYRIIATTCFHSAGFKSDADIIIQHIDTKEIITVEFYNGNPYIYPSKIFQNYISACNIGNTKTITICYNKHVLLYDISTVPENIIKEKQKADKIWFNDPEGRLRKFKCDFQEICKRNDCIYVINRFDNYVCNNPHCNLMTCTKSKHLLEYFDECKYGNDCMLHYCKFHHHRNPIEKCECKKVILPNIHDIHHPSTVFFTSNSLLNLYELLITTYCKNEHESSQYKYCLNCGKTT
jgi:hypothetical protein